MLHYITGMQRRGLEEMFLSQRQSYLTLKGLSIREYLRILGFPHNLRNLSFQLFLIITPNEIMNT